MVQIGKTTLNLTRQQGAFTCPGCRQTRPYLLRDEREFLTLYFVPVFPLQKVGEHVYCQVCKSKFPPQVLLGGEAAASTARRLESRHVSRGVVLAALRLILGDGRATTAELTEAQRLIRDRTGIQATLEEIEGQGHWVAGEDKPTTAELLARTPGLGDVALERAVRDLFSVASADGDLRSFQTRELAEIPRQLGIKQARFRRLIGQVVEV